MLEIRDGGPVFAYAEGLGTTWSHAGKPYFIASRAEGTFLEQIKRGAFSDAVEGREDVDLRVEHLADGPVLASTHTNTLHFRDEDRGLLLTAALRKSDPDAAVTIQKVSAGSYSGLSVGMVVRSDHWGKASDGTALRTITNASLREVSFVHRPANPRAAVLSIRKELRAGSGDVIEYRSFYLDGFEQRLGIRPGPDTVPEDGVRCPECKGDGRQGSEICVACRGFGWVDQTVLKAMKNGAMIDGAATSAGRSEDLELNAIMARSDAIAAEARLYIAQYRKAHPPPDLDIAAIRREGAELELEALALVAGGSSNHRGNPNTNKRSPR
jgi:HK97 family phage prohead protease